MANGILAKISLKEKIGYGIGDLGFNFYWANISAFLLIFYTDVFGISAAAAGTMMLVTKIVDAFTDPAMGALADRTKSKFGNFRPYLLYAGLPMAAAGVLTYTTPDLAENGKLIWAYGTYTLMMMVYTVLNIPYSALSGVITAESQERTTLISFRFIAAFSGTIIVNFFTLDLVDVLGKGNETLGWQLTMALYGIAAAIVFTIVFFSTKERITSPPKQNTNVASDIKDLFQNKPWLVLFSLALIIMITITMRAGASIYYVKYYVERPELIKYFLTAYGIALAVGAAITPMLTKFIDKKRLMVYLMSATGILSIAFFFIPKDAVWLMFTLHVFIGLVLGPKSPLAFSMYADTADYTEWKTGRRATAMTFSAANFSQKLGGALASFIIGTVLASLGYVANEAQSDASQTGIVVVISVIPGVFALLAAFIMRFYTLNNVLLEKVQLELKERKEKE
ncbi:MAG: MFS transporter [Salinivirgaceae bacterium]|jgi:GPH family glycoside/pentoside/hexuronide:cation symporter|nr:MFS transporter [Salinivirgaceae bacterium]